MCQDLLTRQARTQYSCRQEVLPLGLKNKKSTFTLKRDLLAFPSKGMSKNYFKSLGTSIFL